MVVPRVLHLSTCEILNNFFRDKILVAIFRFENKFLGSYLIWLEG